MYAAIRQAKAKTGTAEELARRVKEGAIPIISDVEGFMAYYVVYAPDDTVTAISVFNNFAGAEEANRRALAWIEQNLGPPLVGPASAVAGPVSRGARFCSIQSIARLFDSSAPAWLLKMLIAVTVSSGA